eukprot:jgi/Galph1/4233/GphlegSOOS_G2931.1
MAFVSPFAYSVFSKSSFCLHKRKYLSETWRATNATCHNVFRKLCGKLAGFAVLKRIKNSVAFELSSSLQRCRLLQLRKGRVSSEKFAPLKVLFSHSVLAKEESTENSAPSSIFSTDAEETVSSNVAVTEKDENKLTLDQLQLNREYEGKVVKLTGYGAFIDVGAVNHCPLTRLQGLLHVSHMSDAFVKDPSEVVKEGDVVKVRILRVDLERGLFSLTMRNSLERKPRTNTSRGSAPREDTRRGRNVRIIRMEGAELSKALLQFAKTVDREKFFNASVLNIADFGVFVNVGAPKDGLIFRADLTEEVQAGDVISVRIKKIDVARNFVTCTMKPMEEYERSLPLVRGEVDGEAY